MSAVVPSLLLLLSSVSSAPQDAAPDARVRWLHPSIGVNTGASGFLILDRQPYAEIVMGSGNGGLGNTFLHTLTYSSREQDLSHGRFLAEPGDEFQEIALGDVLGSAAPEIARLHRNGLVDVLDAETFARLGSFTTPTQDTYALALADTDGDGRQEILVTSTGQLYVHDGSSGALLWSFNGAGGRDVVCGEMDGDPSLEIAVSSGKVLDGASRTIQWTWNAANVVELAAADLDQDSLSELAVMESNSILTAYHVDTGSAAWQLPTRDTAFRFVDVEDDGRLELLHLLGSSSYYACSDALTLVENWRLYIDEGIAEDLILLDFDRDGTKELLWSAGDGQCRVQVLDWRTGAVVWENPPLSFSWIGPELGDLDGDSIHEMVTVSPGEHSGRDGAFITVFDLDNDDPIAASDPVAGNASSGDTFSLALHDLDRDGNEEILVGADSGYDGVIEAYDFSGGALAVQWSNATRPPGVAFSCVAAADLDSDGDVEVLGGVRRLHSGSTGARLYAYDYPSGAESWRSLTMGTQGADVLDVRIGDTDGDGHPNVVALLEQNSLYVFDGRTKALQAIFFGDYTALALGGGSGPRRIFAGDVAGAIEAIGHSGGAYVSLGTIPFGVGLIDGITMSSLPGKAWIGSQGRLHYFDLASTSQLWLSGYFGDLFGRKVVELGNGPRGFASAGRYCVAGHMILGP